MNKSIRVGIFQQDIFWQDISANQQKIENLLENLAHKPDILVLPEMYSTGFNQNPTEISKEQIAGQLNWQLSISNIHNLAIFGSIIETENDLYYNRVYFTQPDGTFDSYNKRHLFGIGGEEKYFSPGENRLIFKYNSISIMPQICYDLRFPVWSRNNMDYHILIYSANWPGNRSEVWDTLLKARAIENQCYTVGVNRSGTDGNSIKYIGKSAVYGPKGETILLMNDQETYSEVVLSIDELLEFRKSFPVLIDADIFEIKIRK
jgi:omega-amidase